MVARRIGISILIFGLLVVFLLWYLSSMHESTWQASGTILGFGADETSVFIAHGDIPGLMPAMTMPFDVDDSETIADLEVQDSVLFDIRVSGGHTVAGNFVVVRAGHAGRSLLHFPNLPPVGAAVPLIDLTDMDGKSIRLGRPESFATLVTFIYTRCPLPDFCPLMSRRFQALQGPILDAFGAGVRLLSISFDPEWDTSAVLSEYASRYTRDTSNWRFASGTTDQIGRATEFFGVTLEVDGTFFDHNLTTALIDSTGAVYALWPGNDWQPDDVMRVLGELFSADSR